jgi:hypothetical protein
MTELVQVPGTELLEDNDVPQLMRMIRPQWQAKGLIERVRKLLPVDASSACQRLLNAAIADLRDKIKMAGIDIAKEVAAAYSLPPVNRVDDVDNYSTAKIIDLSYRMGLLTRPEWRRMTRAYDIRRDLEHEDSEYEAGIEDVVYIFKTCIEAVLSKDPITLVRVADFKSVVEVAGPAVADARLIEDFEHAPDTRQSEILKFLISVALDESGSDLVRSNAFTVIGAIAEHTRSAVVVEVARHLQEKVGRRGLTDAEVRVAQQSGTFPYLRKAQKRAYFQAVYQEWALASPNWRSNAQHGGILRALIDIGGVETITEDERLPFIKWMTLCFLGEPGGYGAGIGRPVFFSNSAAPLIKQLFELAPDIIRPIIQGLAKDKDVKAAMGRSKDVARRYDLLLDLVEET